MMQTQIINELVKLAQLFFVRVEKQADLRKIDLLKCSEWLFSYGNVKYYFILFFFNK